VLKIYEIKRAIKSIQNGHTPSLQYIKNESVRKILRGFINGNQPSIKVYNDPDHLEIEKELRSLLK